jgi:hypothetical protein
MSPKETMKRRKFKTCKCVGGGKKNLLFGGIKSNSRIYDESNTGRKNNNAGGGEQNNKGETATTTEGQKNTTESV